MGAHVSQTILTMLLDVNAFSFCNLDLYFNYSILLCSDLIHKATDHMQLNSKANKSRIIHAPRLKTLLMLNHPTPHNISSHIPTANRNIPSTIDPSAS